MLVKLLFFLLTESNGGLLRARLKHGCRKAGLNGKMNILNGLVMFLNPGYLRIG